MTRSSLGRLINDNDNIINLQVSLWEKAIFVVPVFATAVVVIVTAVVNIYNHERHYCK
jgi:hypothetical protein